MATLDVLTLAEGKEAVRQTATGGGAEKVAETEAKVARWITSLSHRLDELVGPVVQRAVSEEIELGVEWDEFFLSQFPISSITSVTQYDVLGEPTVLLPRSALILPENAYRTRPYSKDPTLLGNSLRCAQGYFYPDWSYVQVEYVAGRFADTESVSALYKDAAKLAMKNAWRAEIAATATMGEYDVPQINYPVSAIGKAVRDLLDGQIIVRQWAA